MTDEIASLKEQLATARNLNRRWVIGSCINICALLFVLGCNLYLNALLHSVGDDYDRSVKELNRKWMENYTTARAEFMKTAAEVEQKYQRSTREIDQKWKAQFELHRCRK